MIFVGVYKQSNYPVSVKKIKESVIETLEDHGVVSDSEVEVAIVGKRKMTEFSREYYKRDSRSRTHPILTFSAVEIKKPFTFPPDGKNHLGEIVISYQAVVDEAKKTGKLIDDVAVALAKHGALHLVGEHH